jgi:hypothetical protein
MHDEGKYHVSRAWIRGSNVGVRIFAVAVLVLGLTAGLTAGYLKQRGDNDSLEVRGEFRAAQDVNADFQAPPVDTNQPQPIPAGARARQLRAEQEAQARAKAAAQAKAEAARRAAKAKADAAKRAAAERASRAATRPPTSGGEAPPPVPTDCASLSGNRRIGCSLLSWAGFGTDQFSCLDKLFAKESGWRTNASNPSSGAYGIPQALPGDKMAAYGDDWRTNPTVQIKWGLNYIKGRYQTPCGAWEHSQSTGWY